ncbi:MAG: type IV pilus twitching motility protein PilT [Thermovirga sp.]
MEKPDNDEPLIVIGAFPWGEENTDAPENPPKTFDHPSHYGFPTVTVRFPQLEGDAFLQNMISIRASDIHLKAGFPPLFRMDNLKLHVAENMDPLSDKDIGEFLIALLGRTRFAEIMNGQEIDFVYASGNGERFRMNAFLSMGFPSLSIRHIRSVIPPIDKLGLPGVMRKLSRSPSGLLLVTGPTGSGKSTTLASIVEEINLNKNVHIITLEDPVEYVFHSKKALINQRQIGKDAQNFHQALSKVLRQDPNIIMVGEMRDLETISLAVTAAETGHLVMATLHTRDAPGSIDRIVDVFPAAQQEQIKAELANTLLGVCSQQLLPKIGGGRILATEMLVGTNAVRNRVRTGGTQQLRNIMLTSPEEGMYTFEQNLARLVKDHLITFETATAHAGDAKDLKRFLEI